MRVKENFFYPVIVCLALTAAGCVTSTPQPVVSAGPPPPPAPPPRHRAPRPGAGGGAPPPPRPLLGGAPATPRVLYERNCAVCHGPRGEGTQLGTMKTPPLNSGAALTDPDERFLKQISDGGNGMPPFKY